MATNADTGEAGPPFRKLPDAAPGYEPPIPRGELHQEWNDPTGQERWTIRLDVTTADPLPHAKLRDEVWRAVQHADALARELERIYADVPPSP